MLMVVVVVSRALEVSIGAKGICRAVSIAFACMAMVYLFLRMQLAFMIQRRRRGESTRTRAREEVVHAWWRPERLKANAGSRAPAHPNNPQLPSISIYIYIDPFSSLDLERVCFYFLFTILYLFLGDFTDTLWIGNKVCVSSHFEGINRNVFDTLSCSPASIIASSVGASKKGRLRKSKYWLALHEPRLGDTGM